MEQVLPQQMMMTQANVPGTGVAPSTMVSIPTNAQDCGESIPIQLLQSHQSQQTSIVSVRTSDEDVCESTCRQLLFWHNNTPCFHVGARKALSEMKAIFHQEKIILSGSANAVW